MSCHRVTEKPRFPAGRRLRRQRTLAAGFALLLLAAGGARAQEGDGLQLHTGDGAWQPAAMLETSVEMRVHGLLAEVEVRQRFVNDTDAWLEGRYLLPLPETSAVHALRVEVGERLIEGEVREKQAARAEYELAAATGTRAALVEQNRPNLFRTQVANIAPGEAVTVTVGYWQRVDHADGVFSLALPLTLTPRYSPGCTVACEGPGESLPAATSARKRTQALQPTVAIHVELDAGIALASVDSPTHAVHVSRQGESWDVRLGDMVVEGDRDFALEWRAEASKEVASALFVETVGDSDYALVMLVPPTLPVQALPRELLLVVDTSGSMHGTSIEQARAAVLGALDRLGPMDRFNVVRFQSFTEALFDAPVPADAAHLDQARAWVAGFTAEGGTDLAPALDRALAGGAPEGWLRQVVLVTDAAIDNEAQLLSAIDTGLGESRLFPVGIGSAPNGFFLREAARLGRGSHVLVRDIGEVGERMDQLFSRLDRPAMRDLDVAWPAGAEVYPERLPDLYAGEPLLAVARLPRAGGGVLKATGWSSAGAWNDTLVLGARAGTDDGVGRLWAREKLTALEDLLRGGASEDAVRPLMLDVALEHHLVSRYTSLVAVDRSPVRPPEAALDSAQFANAAPAGSLAFAAGGTGSRSRLSLAIALGLIALALAQRRGRPTAAGIA